MKTIKMTDIIRGAFNLLSQFVYLIVNKVAHGIQKLTFDISLRNQLHIVLLYLTKKNKFCGNVFVHP